MCTMFLREFLEILTVGWMLFFDGHFVSSHLRSFHGAIHMNTDLQIEGCRKQGLSWPICTSTVFS